MKLSVEDLVLMVIHPKLKEKLLKAWVLVEAMFLELKKEF